MWLGAYRASSHEVYFGEDRGRIENATRDSDLFRGSYQTNIFVPGNLESGKTYYWRVDAVKDQGTIRGDTWRFTVEEITK
jgi:hypothetical protein